MNALNISHRKIKNVFFAAMLSGVLALTGCATSAPEAKFTQTIAQTARLHANDQATVTVEATNGVSIVDYEKQRITQRIKEKLDGKKILNAATREERDYEVDLILTEYEKGSAFAHAMLAGLGQIHISGLIKVYSLPSREKVGEFTLTKTFAWGGLYGASTTIEDAEVGFAEGVANALTGQTDVPPKSTPSAKGSG